MRCRVWVGTVLWCGVVLSAAAGTAVGQSVCTAAQVEAADSGCPAGGDTCRIATALTVGNGCSLDFGERDLVIAQSGRLVSRSGAMSIHAGSLNVNGGGLIDGRGVQAGDQGSIVMITVSRTVTVQGPNGAIDVSADDGGGMIILTAGGNVSVGGRLRSVGNIRFGGGGEIIVRSDGDVNTTISSQVIATGAREGGVGGLIDITARGRVELGSVLDVDGSDGGEVNLYSGTDLILRSIEARGTSDAGSGGCVGVQADASLQVLDVIAIDGAGSSQGSGGGCGGFGCFEARYGDLTIRESITSEGADPDGGGGSLAFIAEGGSIILQPGKLISVRGNGRQGCGGEICIDASRSVDAQSLLDSSGGLAGGDIDLSAGKDITIGGEIDVTGRGIGSCAGTVLVEAGFDAVGNVQVTSAVAAGSGGCGTELGCGIGGLAQFRACRVGLTAAGSVDVQAGQGGTIELIGREQIQVMGPLTATKSVNDPGAKDGTIGFFVPPGSSPAISGTVRPLPNISVTQRCTKEIVEGCLMPCPGCGNSVVEFPETCDNGGGANPQSCDGCSLTCQSEDCDDGLNCTFDSCNPQRGCRHAPVELPSTPCYEPSEATPTSTRTSSPTGSATPTRTATATRVGSVPTSTRTPTVTPTNVTTTTPATDCTGDCDGSGRVSVNELVRGVNILLESQPLSACPSFDRNASNTVTVDELVAAVRIALGDGCP